MEFQDLFREIYTSFSSFLVQILNYVLTFLVVSYIGNVICILFGSWKLYDTIKNVSTEKSFESILQPKISGIIGGVGSIILGIVCIILKIIGKM